ncbi:MAG: hypothetical protein JW982_16960 [Spirochaetes bacterium]|nr:hypothetical protein [Spirochaetota bacterium]
MYWVIEADLQVKGLASIMDLPDDIEGMEWMCGKEMPDRKQPISLNLNRGSGSFRGDIMGGILPLYSDDLRDLFNEYGINNIQYFPVDITDTILNEVEYGYSLVNIIGLISCVKNYDFNLSPLARPSSLEKFSIDPAKTFNLPIFRLFESRRLIVINDDLRNYLSDKGLAGVRITKTEEYTVW